tara:strand:+ start:152740 stop:153417 length:678 start_codon:yes stop_codon:yes gene_type:complete
MVLINSYKIQIKGVLNKVNFPYSSFSNLYNQSEEVVLFGSCATNSQNIQSDIDILFVCEEESIRAPGVDFICTSRNKINSKEWLGSEIANHIAKYGIWLKGKGSWREKVFISSLSIENKQKIIVKRVSHILAKKEKLNSDQLNRLSVDVFLNLGRLWFLINGKAVPVTKSVSKEMVDSDSLWNWFFLGKPLRGNNNSLLTELRNLVDKKEVIKILKTKYLGEGKA